LTDDLGVLARIAMSALLYDAGRPIVAGEPGEAVPARGMSEDDYKRLPAATALALTALGQLRPASLVRSVVDYEAQWHRYRSLLGPVYAGARPASVMARLVATAQRFNELLTLDPAADRAYTPDEAITVMKTDAEDDIDRSMIDLLVGAIGMFPSGTPVELNTGERGVVVRTPEHPAQYVRPTVQLVYGADGRAYGRTVLVDLVTDTAREVARIVADGDERLRAASDVAFARARSSLPPGPASSPSATPLRRSRPPSMAPQPAASLSLPPSATRSSAPPPSAPRPEERAAVTAKVAELLSRSQLAPPGSKASAMGALGRTPVSHLLIHAQERCLTGSILLVEEQGEFVDEHAVYFQAGRPGKVYTSNLIAPLSAMLVSAGLVDKEQLEDGSLRRVASNEAELEAALVEQRLVAEAELVKLRADQVLERLASLFGLARATSYYAFFPETDLLTPLWGRVVGCIAPRAALARGIRAHPDDVTIDLVLARANDYVPKLCPGADLESFAFSSDQLDVVMHISQEPGTTQHLLAGARDIEATRSVLYTLLLTRCVILVEPEGGGS
jgi:hypothetical protein